MRILEGPEFSINSIIERLISRRVKLAKKNHDEYIVHNYCCRSAEDSRIDNHEDHDSVSIYSIMPPRRSWVSLTRQERNFSVKKKSVDYYFPIESTKQNERRLRLTIVRDMQKFPRPEYLGRLEEFINKIQTRVSSIPFELSTPEIIPKKKEVKAGSKKEMRPICIFSLEDNIILQETNRLLTRKFDVLFTHNSFAFRSMNSKGVIPSHHDTIEKIIEYQAEHKNEQIFVAECDLKKFFDSINHLIIKRAFYNALSDPRVELSCSEARIAEQVFIAYLDAYDFQRCVCPLNTDLRYKEENQCTEYTFPWISEPDLKIYDDYSLLRIGVPQGGALSGLIANLVLNEVDIHIDNLKDESLLYLRYCDDMIMLHTDKMRLMAAFALYQKIVKAKKLFIHIPVQIENYSSKFYDDKSKEPYTWGDCRNNSGNIPWISFVGYQIGYEGEIRVRKSSIKKEVDKQLKVVSRAIIEVKDSNESTINKERIKLSVAYRLRGMSVGRIAIFWPRSDSTMCWANGFRKLNANQFSLKQMSYLDRHRTKAMRRLYSFLRNLDGKSTKEELETSRDIMGDRRTKKRRNKDPILYHGKPYSYYGWLERKSFDKEFPK